ncbi:hypothetical protein, partial [Tenacibaculum sp. SG-28]|uniref:hypothetical protein n=1 Tax=Tenacibaculum sp. SG-28 TaxID=754426 RepID=UPI0013050030
MTFEKNYAILKKAKQPENLYLELLTKIIEDDRQTRLAELDKRFLSLQNEPDNPTISWVFHLIEGYKYMHYAKNSRKSFLSFSKAYGIAKKLNAIELENFSLLSILKLFSKGIITDKNYTNYLKEYKLVSKTNTDWFYYFYYTIILKGLTKSYEETQKQKVKSDQELYWQYKQFDSIVEKSDSSKKYLSYYFHCKGNKTIKTNPNKAKELYLKSATYFTDSPYFRFRKYITLCNLSRVAALEGEHEKGLAYLNKAKKYVSANDSLQDMHDISVYKAIHFNQMGIHDSAYHHEHQARLLTYALNFQKHNTEITAIKTALDTEKKDKENIALRSKRQQDKALLIGAGAILLLGSGIGYLTITNSRKKRLLAEKQEAIEKQKNLTLLKEQEITIINAMIDGQEKERKLIA